jgi:hypothetical protein
MKYLVTFGEIVSARHVRHAIELASARLEAMPASELEGSAEATLLREDQQNWPTSQRVRNRQAKAQLFVERSGLRYVYRPGDGIPTGRFE